MSRSERRQRRIEARRARQVALRRGTNLRASPLWATIVQALAFVRKELAEIIRQPKLLLLLVAGPFLLLLLFGAGYRDTTIRLRTEFVGPADSVYEDAVARYDEVLSDYIIPVGYTTDEASAVRRLANDDVDAVVVFPTDALDRILAGQRAPIRVLHRELDPFHQAAIEISSRLAIQEANASVLSAIAGGAQSALAPASDLVADLSARAAQLTAGVQEQDHDAIRAAGTDMSASIATLHRVLTQSHDVVERLNGRDELTDRALDDLESAAQSARQLGEADGADLIERAEALAASLDGIVAVAPDLTTVDPAVLTQPFEAHTETIIPVEIDHSAFFAPGSIVLLLQHLALTFAALSLVRDRELGLFELLRVGPLSSIEILAGKTVAYLIVGAGVGAVLVVAAVYALGVPFRGSVAWAAATVGLVLLAALALGLLLSLLSGSETQAVQYAMLTLLAGMFFSGFILPITGLAMPFRLISFLLPVTYGISMLQDVMLLGIAPSSGDVIGLAALVTAYGAIAVGILRRKLHTE